MHKRPRRAPSAPEASPVGRTLLDGEQVSFDADVAAPKATDEELNSRYAKGEIRIVTEQARYPLAGILQMLRETLPDESGHGAPRYQLDPEYQRRHRWCRCQHQR